MEKLVFRLIWIFFEEYDLKKGGMIWTENEHNFSIILA